MPIDIIKVPIKISKYTQDEVDNFESLGIKYDDNDYYDGEMFLNKDAITAFLILEDSIDLELNSGNRLLFIIIYYSVSIFKKSSSLM